MKKWDVSLFLILFFTFNFQLATFNCFSAEEPVMEKRYYGVSWDFKKGDEGWQPTHGVSPFDATKNGIKFSVTAFDPWLTAPEPEVDAKVFQYISVRA